MRVVLTRPVQDSGRWAEALRMRGHEVVLLPLIEIAPAPDGEALRRAAARLGGCDAAMFVSANAVRGFMAALGGAPWPARARAWATGPGTAQALLEAGVPPGAIDTPPAQAAQFDSEALWAVVGPQVHAGTRVLVSRGAGEDGRAAGRDWLASRLEETGASVDTVAAYARRVPTWTSEQAALARRCAAEATWLFSSSQAVGALAKLLPGQDWSGARAVATHERIAQAARDAGFGVVWVSRAAEADVIATLESSG